MINQVLHGKCKSNDAGDTHMANTTLIHSPTKNAHKTSTALRSPTEPINKSSGRKTSFCKNQVHKLSGVENYGKILEMEGISRKTAKLIFMSRRSGSIAVYELA